MWYTSYMRETFIYFILAPSEKLVKIKHGCGDIDNHLQQLRANCPVPLEPLGCFPARHRFLSIQEQLQLQPAHERGTWYRDGPEIRQFIEDCKVLYSKKLES